ncbi:RteC domain-containing protein [Myroides pelagicus]|uniref:RteC domain-containing protein n=1 Tax=Myroides pelagicus TaxID=270914 RepID=UPI002DBE0ADA|nr:RteC domain-containing protein [Myroides pelagicus]MEC4115149.1 RteC domain-containing protein [Myroides pelagicus]
MELITNSNVIKQISELEKDVTFKSDLIIEESQRMIKFLKNHLHSLKLKVLEQGFCSDQQEIEFYKHIKPYLLGKLIFYNKVYRIESQAPINMLSVQQRYYNKKLDQLIAENKNYINHSDFYIYYKSKKTHNDHIYFKTGNIDLLSGVNSIVFEIDPNFSTHYDFKIAKILSCEQLSGYLNHRLSQINKSIQANQHSSNSQSITWTESQSSLVELIYALYTSNSLNHGNVDIKTIADLLQNMFNVNLSDVHHSFHRMKTRTKSRTMYLDKLATDLQEYMNDSYK